LNATKVSCTTSSLTYYTTLSERKGGEYEMNNKKLFIGNLPYTATEDELRDLFSTAGTVESVSIIMDKFTGRAKGFGFVEMSTEEEAQNAVKTLNQKDLGGRQIAVDIARPMVDRGDRGPRQFGGGNDRRGGNGGGGYSRGNRDNNY